MEAHGEEAIHSCDESLHCLPLNISHAQLVNVEKDGEPDGH